MASGADERAGSDRVRALRAGRRLALAAVFEADFGQRPADAVLERHLAEIEGDPRASELARTLVRTVLAHLPDEKQVLLTGIGTEVGAS